MIRGVEPAGLRALTVELGRAAAALAEAQRASPPDVAVRLGDVERWLRHQEVDLRRRAQALAGDAHLGAGYGVLVIGERVERGTFVAGDLIVEAGQDAARQAGPLGPMIDDGATLAAHAVEGVGTSIRRTAEADGRLLITVGKRLRRHTH